MKSPICRRLTRSHRRMVIHGWIGLFGIIEPGPMIVLPQVLCSRTLCTADIEREQTRWGTGMNCRRCGATSNRLLCTKLGEFIRTLGCFKTTPFYPQRGIAFSYIFNYSHSQEET